MGASTEWSVRTRPRDLSAAPRGVACLVEPDHKRRAQLGAMLSSMGYVVHETPVGQIGLQLAEQVGLRVAVVNVLIGDMQGLRLIRQMRMHAPSATIVAISDPAQTSGPVTLARAAGADAALVAPVSANALAAVLDEPETWACSTRASGPFAYSGA